MSSQDRSSKSLTLGVVLLLALAVLVWLLRGRIHFDWHSLFRQLQSVSVGRVLAGMAIIYAGYWLRALRWVILVRPLRRTKASELLAPQLIGFSATNAIGRLADLVRPYLIARKLGLPVASQLAVYSVERAFDLGAAAVIFSLTLAVAPHDLPHHAVYVRAGVLSLVGTAGIAAFAVALRVAGTKVPAIFKQLLKPISEKFAARVAERVLDFSQGMQVLSSLREFLAVAGTSLLMWLGIAASYMLSARAFVADPVLGHLSFTATMLLMASSMGGSLIQLPVLGWFTQIAVVGAALHGFFGVPLETASACGAVVFFVLNLDVVPVGIIAARFEGTSLREAVSQSSAAETASASKPS
jgi:glycosyltransferase 2 family protein